MAGIFPMKSSAGYLDNWFDHCRPGGYFTHAPTTAAPKSV